MGHMIDRRDFQVQLRGTAGEQIGSNAGDPDEGGFCGGELHEYHARRFLAERLATSQPLRFFYHVTGLTRPSVDLPWINRAEGWPLESNLDAAAFEERYGMPRDLAFRPYTRQKPRRHWDFWANVYR